MIPIDISKLELPPSWEEKSKRLTDELKQKPSMEDKIAFIDAKRDETWRDPALLKALQDLVGNKCWYSELPLEGHDVDVDHFRPKGRIGEVDEQDLKAKMDSSGGTPKRVECDGYWWLAFDYRNFRLSSQHANQRRNDKIGGTDGGKWDHFPVEGTRCTTVKDWDLIHEAYLALDPCSKSDVSLLRFNPEGVPEFNKSKNNVDCAWDERRVRLSIWLFHLDKAEIVRRRKERMVNIAQEFSDADIEYRNWKSGNLASKASFDRRLRTIMDYMKDDAVLAGAARSMKRYLSAKYDWIEDYI